MKKENDNRAVLEQVRWERDVAIEQLGMLGFSLGEITDPFLFLKKRIEANQTEHLKSTSEEILCDTLAGAEVIANLLEILYVPMEKNVTVLTGYYDPAEDLESGETDRCSGWWYITVE